MALDPALLIGLRVLQPYLEDLVIAGGWVPYLYAAHEEPSQDAVALKTRDLDLEVVFERSDSAGVDALLNQRPGTAYSGLGDDQFRQYAWSVMQMLLEMMRKARSAHDTQQSRSPSS